MFVAGLSGLKKCKLVVSKHCSRSKEFSLFHLLFESQNESIITSMLGDETIVRTVDSCRWSSMISPYDAYVLGYCISLSRCQWKLVLHDIYDEHIDMMKQAIASWGCGNGRIITFAVLVGFLTSDGVGHLLSLPHNTLSDLGEITLWNIDLDSEACELLASCLSSLPQLEDLDLALNKIGCEGVELLSQSLRSNTTLKLFNVNKNNIGDRGGCSLAKALSMNKHLLELDLTGNPLGEESIQQLIASLQHNNTLQQMNLPFHWQNFAQRCVGYDVIKDKVSFSFGSIPWDL